jgi:hypothetical protein
MILHRFNSCSTESEINKSLLYDFQYPLQLVTLLKKDPFEDLAKNEIDPVEERMSKENQEIQMYLKEFSPKDPLTVKDFEDAAIYCSGRIERLPKYVWKRTVHKYVP